MVYIITRSKSERSKLHITDNPKSKEVMKIGKEINRAKQFGYTKEMIQSEFGKDAAGAVTPKQDKPEWVKTAAKEIVDKIRQGASE